jgi:hypothetical protein
MRRIVIAGSLLAGGCKQPEQQQPPPVNEVARADVAKALWRDPVTAERYARRVLYTWTTAEQIAELRRDRRVLVREESPQHGASYFEQVVHVLADRDSAAKLLDTVTFAKSRYAWPAPWATHEGWPGEVYGDELIRVTLKPGAVVLALTTGGRVEARDLAGALVPIVDVLAHPERLAAVYFTADPGDVAPGVPRPPNAFREYVLCNESMIAAWSVGTQDIADELAAEIAALDALARELRAGPATPELAAGYASALALRSPAYALDPGAIEQVIAHLRAVPRPPAFEGGGDVAWPGIGVPRPPPRVVRKRTGTYGSFAGSY